MDPKDFINLKKEITKLSEGLDSVVKTVNGMKLTQQRFLKGNDLIPPGVATKVAFDGNGLILKKMDLDIDDLPEIPIDKISGLRRVIHKIEGMELKTLERSTEVKPPKKIIPQTGIKLNLDSEGNIIGSSDLIANDIPELPMEKIIGLTERISLLEQKEAVIIEEDDFKINAGTATRITWDNRGRIISGDRLTMHDLPKELVDDLVKIHTDVAEMALQENVNNWIIENKKKLNSLSEPTDPGIYTKVNVNSDGLVVKGDRLTIDDLPEITIRDITDLDKLLRFKIERTELIELQNSISTLLSYDPKVDIQLLKNHLRNKVEEEEFFNVKNEMVGIKKRLEEVDKRLPCEGFQIEFKQLIDSITTLQGQVKSIEQKVMDKEFCTISEKSEGE